MSGDTSTDRLTPIGDAAGRTVYYDDRDGTYHTWCDDGDYEPVSTALVLAVSSVLGVEPDDLDALWECIDPDALNRIFVHWRDDGPRVGDGTITFTFAQCAVTVRADGEIVIDPQRPPEASG